MHSARMRSQSVRVRIGLRRAGGGDTMRSPVGSTRVGSAVTAMPATPGGGERIRCTKDRAGYPDAVGQTKPGDGGAGKDEKLAGHVTSGRFPAAAPAVQRLPNPLSLVHTVREFNLPMCRKSVGLRSWQDFQPSLTFGPGINISVTATSVIIPLPGWTGHGS